MFVTRIPGTWPFFFTIQIGNPLILSWLCNSISVTHTTASLLAHMIMWPRMREYPKYTECPTTSLWSPQQLLRKTIDIRKKVFLVTMVRQFFTRRHVQPAPRASTIGFNFFSLAQIGQAKKWTLRKKHWKNWNWNWNWNWKGSSSTAI